MLGDLFNNPIAFIFTLASLVVAITIHEFAHAITADRLGDPTPRLQGRLTLDPRAHLDPFGTLLLLIARFGWGKPVQFDPYNLKNPRRDAALISLAGPSANIILAITASILLRILLVSRFEVLANPFFSPFFLGITNFLQPLIVFNVILAIFNLVPIHPLDGFKIVEGLLPATQAREWHKLERYGLILLFLAVFPIISPVAPVRAIISPIINVFLVILLPGVGNGGII